MAVVRPTRLTKPTIARDTIEVGGVVFTADDLGNGASELDELSDVVITSAVAGQRLRFNGTNWVNSSLRWEPHVDYAGSVMLDSAGNPLMHEVTA